MNPITLFRGWRARRWCERWARERQRNDSLRLGLEQVVSDDYFNRFNAYMDKLAYYPVSLKRLANGVGPTPAHAWLALKRELEARDATH